MLKRVKRVVEVEGVKGHVLEVVLEKEEEEEGNVLKMVVME